MPSYKKKRGNIMDLPYQPKERYVGGECSVCGRKDDVLGYMSMCRKCSNEYFGRL